MTPETAEKLAEDLIVGFAITPTLRDYFAGQALTGYLAMYSTLFAEDGVASPDAGAVALAAYHYADCMLLARDAHK